MIMNRKIFTLLASTLMLFSTAFTVNAKIIGGNLAVGDTVRTLPIDVANPGMYHIRIDSILIKDDGSGKFIWKDVSKGTTTLSPPTHYYGMDVNGLPNNGFGDTIVLAVTDAARVVPVSVGDLRRGNATYLDLQSTMWCTYVFQRGGLGSPQQQTIRFTNKVFDRDLNYADENSAPYLGDEDPGIGWMFSNSYGNGKVNYSRPIYRFSNEEGKYSVLIYKNGFIIPQQVDIENFVADKIDGLLKFTLVEVAPLVLDANAFSTKLGAQESGLVKLEFNGRSKETINDNFFAEELSARNDIKYGEKGYLNLFVDGDVKKAIYNKKGDYINDLGQKFFDIKADNVTLRNYAPNDSINTAYRFVYFPSKDSLVINALRVWHKGNPNYNDGEIADKVAIDETGKEIYTPDNFSKSSVPIYYGLYTNEMQHALIVRGEDLYDGSGSIITIGAEPANVRFSFNTGCGVQFDFWDIQEGLYTIWNDKGECLGVRLYNGSLAPQWLKLDKGECPDRTPSYQWIIEKTPNRVHRVNITNREFGGGYHAGNGLVRMENVLIRGDEKAYPIFQNQSQFIYNSLLDEVKGYVPITYGKVIGQYRKPVPFGECSVTDSSGFRPVTSDYAANRYLGYKHFIVDTDRRSPSFGKSEGAGNKSDYMDYNAFALNYRHVINNEGYVDVKESKGESILYVNTETKDPKGFRFQLGDSFRGSGKDFAPEKYGYPQKDTTYVIKIDGTDYRQEVPYLERYHYELRVADFYAYRDQIEEQYVVLQGKRQYHGTSPVVANKLAYGVADYESAEKQQLTTSNIYLRETYFIEDTVYYAVLDIINHEDFDVMKDWGLQVSDAFTYINGDRSSYRGLVAWGVDNNELLIEARGKTVSSTVVSTFALVNKDYTLYRRLNSVDPEADAADVKDLDAPKTLRFYTRYNNQDFLYEDATSADSYNVGPQFLGLANVPSEKPDQVYNYNMFVDTAYVNRGTGPIKPQYLIAVGVYSQKDTTIVTTAAIPGEPGVPGGDPDCETPATGETGGTAEVKTHIQPYVRGRYLINAADSAYGPGFNGQVPGVTVRDKRYITSTSWTRLVFVDAIHANDRLYIVGEFEKHGIKETDYIVYDINDPATATDPADPAAADADAVKKPYVNVEALEEATKDMGRLPYRVQSAQGASSQPAKNPYYGVYYDFEDWKGYHNDVSFSLRFVKQNAENAKADGTGGSDELTKQFLIESETTDRNVFGNAKIAPVQGGWIMIDNGVPALSHGSYKDAISHAEIFNIAKGNGLPTKNDPVASSGSSVKVISGVDEVYILNAVGKKVTIMNLLGQTLSSTVLKSDNETVKAPKGIIIVSVEGEKAVKSNVK
jgi:hypothetical protein